MSKQMKKAVQPMKDADDSSVELLTLHVWAAGNYEAEAVELPVDASVDDLIVKCGLAEECLGFFAAPRKHDSDWCDYGDDAEKAPESSGLAEILTAAGGLLLEPGKLFSSYGFKCSNSSEVNLFAVFGPAEKQPLVFKKELQRHGFSENVYKYVKLKMCLKVGSLSAMREVDCVDVAEDALVSDLVAAVGSHCGSIEGCVGFIARAAKEDRDGFDSCWDDDDDDEEVADSGLAQSLTAGGGLLLGPEASLGSYGLNCISTSDVILFPVFGDSARHPTVFKKDVQDMGFGDIVYEYVKLNREPKELVEARSCFAGPLLPWLQKGCPGEEGQSIMLSMEDDFGEAPKPILTILITKEDGELAGSCSNLAGESLCSVRLANDDSVAKLCSLLCEKLQWVSMALWDGSERVPPSAQASSYSQLTAERVLTMEHIQGCYQQHNCGHNPAGYGSSGTSASHVLMLEPGKAGLQSCFRGDYKRAEELKTLYMADARWSVESFEGKQVIRIVGEAKLTKYFVHERSGYSGERFSGFQCYAMFKIPLQQLESGQKESYSHSSKAGSGWSCGSESYMSSFFLPMCVMQAIRFPSGDFHLQRHLNRDNSPDYPYNKFSSSGRSVLRVDRSHIDVVKHLRESLGGKASASIEEVIKLEASAPKSDKDGAVPVDSDDE